MEVSFLERIDIFGTGIHITQKGKEKHKSRLGGLFSILNFVLILIYAGL